MLKIKNITKEFNHQPVLKNVSLEGKPGQVIHILGENGSGKSTIFKIISQIIQPTSGEVTIAKEASIGALIENPGFLEFESGLTNLKFLAQLNNNYQATAIKKLMTDFGLDPDNHRAVAKYSLGMRQKLGIIQAIMEEQTIILLDEPTRGLDKTSLGHFVSLIDKLRKQNKLIIIASHDFPQGLVFDHSYKIQDGVLTSES